MGDKKVKSYKKTRVDSILRGIYGCLGKEEPMTPSAIGKCLDIHPRTASKYVDAAENLNMIKCKEIKMGSNTVRLCKVNPKYKEFVKKSKEEK